MKTAKIIRVYALNGQWRAHCTQATAFDTWQEDLLLVATTEDEAVAAAAAHWQHNPAKILRPMDFRPPA